MKVAYFLSQPLDHRNRMRFGLDYWRSQGGEVSVFELTPFQHPAVAKDFVNRKKNRNTKKIKYLYISTIPDCLKALVALVCQKPWLAIDFMGSEISSSLFRIFLRAVKVSRIVFRAGSLPEPKKKLNYSWKQFSKEKIIKKGFNRIARVLAPPQVEFTSSGLYFKNKRKNISTKIFPIHSFDYDLYLKEQSRRIGRLFNYKYAVFLDEDMCFHPDFLYGAEKCPHTPENYFPIIKSLFDVIEKKYKLKVVVAEHPRGSYSGGQCLKYFGRRPVLRNQTPKLVKQCCLVLCHCSTSISFAVLYKKPIIFLTTQQLEGTRYGGIIASLSKELDACRININKKIVKSDMPKVISINQNKYDRYLLNYICPVPDRDGKLLWQKVSESMRALTPTTTNYYTLL